MYTRSEVVAMEWMVTHGCPGHYYDSNQSDGCENKLAKVDEDLEDLIIYDILEPCYHLGETDRPLAVRKQIFGRAWPYRAPIIEGYVPSWPQLLSAYEVLCTGQTMAMMCGIVGQALEKAGLSSAYHPQDYLIFYCLGKRERPAMEFPAQATQQAENRALATQQAENRALLPGLALRCQGAIQQLLLQIDTYSLANSCFPVNQGASASRLHELFLRQFCDAHTCSRGHKPFRRGGKKHTIIFYLAISILTLMLLPIFYLIVFLYQRENRGGTQELRRISQLGRKTKPS